jgi:hypothetical protein
MQRNLPDQYIINDAASLEAAFFFQATVKVSGYFLRLSGITDANFTARVSILLHFSKHE